MRRPPSDNGPPLEFLRAETEGFTKRIAEPSDTTPPYATPPAERLVCVAGTDLGATFALQREAMVIGRGDADIVLRATDVSRRHARIELHDDLFWIDDLGSANGTWVNGTRVVARTRLAVGDRIQVGSTIFVLSRHDELEQRLGQVQKLEAMGALMKGLAHDFNNALSVIQSGLDELSDSGATAAERQQAISDMQTATSSAASLVRRLMRVGTTRSATSELVALAALVDDTLSMLRRSLPDTVELIADVAPESTVYGSAEELRHVIVNLVNNARDSMPDGGCITIRAALVKLDRADALARHLHGEGTFVQMSVSDTGVGMDDTILARVFEPYFTTKPAGKGYGLGLAMVFTTVRNHHGVIWAESRRGEGTTLHLLLPTEKLR